MKIDLHYDAKTPRFKSWETPPSVFKTLDDEFHFTLDAAASHENALCQNYYTKDGLFFRGKPMQNSELDGLKGYWEPYRVFCNPPYDDSLPQWVDKAFQFEVEVAVLLLPPNFSTAWGQRIWQAYQKSMEYIGYLRSEFREPKPWNETRGEPSVEIRLPPGRIRFHRPAFKEGDFLIPGEDDPRPYRLKDYELLGEDIFDYSKPHVPGDAPRDGNLIAIFRK